MAKTSGRNVFDAFARYFERIQENVEQVIQGKPEVVRLAVLTLVSEGHLLIEDVPGVGKTMLAKALSRSLGCVFRRIQFTPDLLPTDITGVQIWTQDGENEFRPGPVFSQVLLADEINRASPKTQAALLEAMEERQVTMDGDTYELERPFMVIATQNPIEHEGTYPLPQAELDRFLMRVEVGYPKAADEMAVLSVHAQGGRVEELEPVAKAGDIIKMIDIAASVHVSDQIRAYIVNLLNATREHQDILLGASPRSGLMLMRASRSLAAAEGREFVAPDDIKALAVHVLGHRLILSPEAQLSGVHTHDVVDDALGSISVPSRTKR